MPWTIKDVSKHNHKITHTHAKHTWVKVANAILEQSGDEGKAIRIANSQADKAQAARHSKKCTASIVEAADEEKLKGKHCQVLMDQPSQNRAKSLYTNHISKEDHSKLPQFIHEVDDLLQRYGGQPELPEDAEEEEGESETPPKKAPEPAAKKRIADKETRYIRPSQLKRLNREKVHASTNEIVADILREFE